MIEKDIFHECVCTGQKMTWEEWAQWVDSHPFVEVVHRCGEFEYNINDVCVNPHKIVDFCDNYKNKFRIETCQIDNGKWGYGVSYWFGTQGHVHGATFTNATYDTERAAVYAALQEVEKRCAKVISEIGRYGEISDNEDEDEDDVNPHNSSYLPKLKAIKNKIEVYKQEYDPMILNLFGW